MKLITTSREGGKWQEREFVFAGGIKSGIPLVIVDETKTYQTHMGFGAAFTEAAALTLREAGAKREEVIRACFGKEGLRYRLGRVPIHSCDFSTGLWTYARENDRELASFDLSHDDALLVPLIKDCKKECGELFLMASPWSPPAWMKENGSMLHGGKLKRDCYSVWADYFVKYILEMEKRGLKIDVVSVQNETEAVQVWESCVYTAEEEAAFVKVLHQAFERAGIAAKIAVVDHNRDIVVNRCLKEFADEEVRSAVWGSPIIGIVRSAAKIFPSCTPCIPKSIFFSASARWSWAGKRSATGPTRRDTGATSYAISITEAKAGSIGILLSTNRADRIMWATTAKPP